MKILWSLEPIQKNSSAFLSFFRFLLVAWHNLRLVRFAFPSYSCLKLCFLCWLEPSVSELSFAHKEVKMSYAHRKLRPNNSCPFVLCTIFRWVKINQRFIRKDHSFPKGNIKVFRAELFLGICKVSISSALHKETCLSSSSKQLVFQLIHSKKCQEETPK